LAKDISGLIEAIDRVGIQNISLLSRMTGMPVETIRYTVKKRFPNLGLKVSMTLNHELVGLERYFVVFKFSDAATTSIPTIMRSLSTEAFLTYWSRTALDRRYVAIFSVPVSLVDEFHQFLERLVKENVMTEYKTKRLDWARHPELKGKYYNFSTGTWNVDWDKISSQSESPPDPVKNEEPSPSPEIDALDTLIIKEMELDAWRNIAEIARKLGLNERTARWHFTKHVNHMANSNYVHWFPASPLDASKAMGLVFEFEGVTKGKLTKLRLLFNNFPFSWFEAGSKDGYYQVHLGLPGDAVMESLRFLNSKLPAIVGEWNTYTLDLAAEMWYTIPYENFDAKKGWVFNKEKALDSVVSTRLSIRK
jgi:hypothetical protein